MNKFEYPTQGSNALKPQAVEPTTSIINFESVLYSRNNTERYSAAQRSAVNPIVNSVVETIKKDSLISAIPYANRAVTPRSKKENVQLVKAALSTFAGVLALILIGI